MTEVSSAKKAKYARFCVLFDAAERRIKQFEKLDFEPCLPAINQLRYAACHIKRSFETSGKAQNECIESAERHCKRALKDVTEACIDYVVAWVADYERMFRFVPISEEIKEHHEIRVQLRKAFRFAASYNHDNIEDVTAQLEESMDIALSVFDIYEAARPELNKRARIQRYKALGVLVIGSGLFMTLLQYLLQRILS